MAVDAMLLSLFTDTVVIENYTGRDFQNVRSFGPPVSYKAHVAAKTEQVIRPTGDTAVATHRVVLTDRFGIDERSRITMPARLKISNPEILAVLEWIDDNGSHHTTVMVGPRSGQRA